MADHIYNPRKLTLLDRAVAVIDPGRALERVIDRTKLHQFAGVYDAARTSSKRGTSGGQFVNATSESWAGNRDRIKLIWDARHAERNIPFIAGVLDREASYTCNKIEYHSDTGVPAIDTIYQDYFHDWCGRCDITGRHRLSTMIELSYRGMRRDGDSGLNMLEEGRELRLQAVEADRIGSPQEPVNQENYFGGMTVDPKTGKVVKIRVFKVDRNGQYVRPEEIEPRRFIHFMRPTRFDQYRGVTPLACILPKARDLYEWMAIAMQNGKSAAIYSAFVKVTDPNKPVGATSWSNVNEHGTPTQQAISGQITKLAQGEDIVFPTGSVQPSGQFMAFIQALIREMALGLNRPYGFIYNLAELGGVNSRIELMQAQRGIQRDQWLIEQIGLIRIKNEVLSRGIAARVIPPHPRWRRGRFGFGAWLTGDVGYQTQTDKDLVRMGVKPLAAWGAEMDFDVIETGRKNAATLNGLKDVAGDSGTLVEQLVPDWQPTATQQFAAVNTPPEPPPQPTPGLIGEVGEKGVGPLVETLEKVTQGTLDRDSAVLALMNIYGWPLAKCQGIVPQPAPLALPASGTAV